MKVVDSALREVLEELFPDVRVGGVDLFQPLLDLKKGHMSTPAAIRVAAAKRAAAGPICEQVVLRLREKVPLRFHSDGGYVVAQADDVFHLQTYASSVDELRAEGLLITPGRVVAALETNDVPLYARLRLQANAALQAWLIVCLTGRCELSLQPGVVAEITTRAQFAEALRKAVSWCLGSVVKRQVPKEALAASGAPNTSTCLWMAHQHSEALPPHERQLLDAARVRDGLVIRMPNDGWLLSRERVLAETLEPKALLKVVERLTSDDLWCRWLFQMASSIPSGELDPAVSLFDDYASPLYGARVLIQRIRKLLVDEKAVGQGGGASFEFSGRLKFLRDSGELDTLVVRSLLLPAWTVRAASEGEVGAWSQVLRDLLSTAHRVLNAPELRQAQESSFSKQILAGIEFGISSILRPVAEDAWPD